MTAVYQGLASSGGFYLPAKEGMPGEPEGVEVDLHDLFVFDGLLPVIAMEVLPVCFQGLRGSLFPVYL